MVELRPRAALAGERAVGPADLEVLDDALDGRAATEGEVSGNRDADFAAVVCHQRGVLEAIGALSTGPVVDMRHEVTRSAVQHEEPEGGRHDDVLVPSAEIGGRDGPVDRTRQIVLPDRGPCRRVEGVDRATARTDLRALDDGQLPVALDVGQGGAAAGDPVQLDAPHLVALSVEDFDRVLVAPTEEAACPRRDAVGTPGEDGPDGGGGVDLLVGVGAADQPALRVEDAEVAAVGVILAVGEAGRRRSARDDVLSSGAVEVAHGGSGEHAVGGELRPVDGR